MTTASRMQLIKEPPVTSASMAEYFAANYDDLLRNAMRITSANRPLSEDLLHDVFLRCTKHESPLLTETDFGRYITRSIHNGYISFLRRETRSISIDPFEASDPIHADLVTDPRTNARINDDIFTIAAYACERKDTSISASIVILRFIHGYFADEAARFLNRSKNAVESRLASARREMEILLTDSLEPAQKVRQTNGRGYLGRRLGPTGIDVDIVNSLRNYIFSGSHGRCFTISELKRIYRSGSRRPEREEAGHLVSCRTCLEKARNLLNLAPLDSRHPLDTIGLRTVVERMHVGAVSSSLGMFLLTILCEQNFLFV